VRRKRLPSAFATVSSPRREGRSDVPRHFLNCGKQGKESGADELLETTQEACENSGDRFEMALERSVILAGAQTATSAG
jgi:hypothetical protein